MEPKGLGNRRSQWGSKQRSLVRVGLVVQVSCSHSSEPGQLRRYLSRHTISVHVYARIFDSSASQMGGQLRPCSTPYAGIGTYIDVAPNISLTPLRAYEAWETPAHAFNRGRGDGAGGAVAGRLKMRDINLRHQIAGVETAGKVSMESQSVKKSVSK